MSERHGSPIATPRPRILHCTSRTEWRFVISMSLPTQWRSGDGQRSKRRESSRQSHSSDLQNMSDQLSSTIDVVHGAATFIDRPRYGLRSRRIAWGILLLALTLTVLEGAVRKWLIGSAFDSTSYLAYFSKDIAFGLLLLMPRRGGGELHGEIFRRWLVPGCFLLIIGATASSLESVDLAGSVLTLRAVLL